jgi:RNA polymerase sigma-70 factor (ECF subfamily)
MSDCAPTQRFVRADAQFADLYDRHHRQIRDYCRRRLACDLVDDATAEIFLVAWRHLDDVPTGADALVWLYRVAYRVVGRQWRSSARRARLDVRLRAVALRPASAADESVVRADEHRLVREAARRLSDADAEVLRLVTWEQLSTAEVAAVLEINPNAVKQRLHRAKQHLAREYRRLDARTTPTNPTPDAPIGGAR